MQSLSPSGLQPKINNIYEVTKMTKLMARNYEDYKNSNATELWDVYGTYSRAKVNAMARCNEIRYKMGGWGLKIVHFNTFVFTAGFEYSDSKTGVLMFAYITPSGVKTCEVAGL